MSTNRTTQHYPYGRRPSDYGPRLSELEVVIPNAQRVYVESIGQPALGVLNPDGSPNCVQLVKELSPQLAGTSALEWKPGRPYVPGNYYEPGTVFASFDANGRYANAVGHVGIYYRDVQTTMGPGIWMLDQGRGMYRGNVGARGIPFDNVTPQAQQFPLANSARNFWTIRVPAPRSP